MTVPAPVYRRTYRRIRRRIVCPCGALKSDATLTRIERGRGLSRLCAKCYERTPEGIAWRARMRAMKRARDRARMRRGA